MITGLLLAAGSARRYGANKLAVRLASGEALAVRAAARLAAAVDRLLVVVRSGDTATAALMQDAGYAVLPCAEAEQGMAHSLACGVRASPDSAAWVVALADMPWIESRTIATLVAAFREHDAIVVPRCAGVSGHPVVFPARHRAELLGLTGDRGARALIEAHAATVRFVDTGDRGVLRDVDTPDDLAGL